MNNEKCEPAHADCGVNIDEEMEHLKKLKERYAKLYDESHGKTIVDYAYWSDEYGMAMVCYHTVEPDDYDDCVHELRSIASEMLHIQNMVANDVEIKRYMELKNTKEKKLKEMEGNDGKEKEK